METRPHKSHPLLLQYHQVGPPVRGGTWVTPRQFRAHLRWLEQRFPLPRDRDHLLRILRGGSGTVITFDDALLDVYREAFPVLSTFGGVGMVFVVTGCMGRRVSWDATFGKRLYHMDREHLLELHRAGWVVASHTHTHPDLTRLTPREREWELRRSREVLEDLLQTEVLFLSYPFNRFNSAVMEDVRRAGYRMAFAGYSGNAYPFSRFRFGIYAPFLSLSWLAEDPFITWAGRAIQIFAGLTGWVRHRWPPFARRFVGMEAEHENLGGHRKSGQNRRRP